MKLILPHLPNNLDVIICSYLGGFCDFPRQYFPLRVEEMSRLKKKNEPPIDLTTIFGVVRSGDLRNVENFIKENGKGVLNSLDKNGITPMHWAVFDGTYEIASYLIENDCDYDNYLSNPFEQRPIHWACVKGRIDMVSLLLDKGVNIDVQDSKGYTPLITACQYGQLALVAFLVSRGANLELDDKNGDNALHWNLNKGYPDLTRLLIIYGVYPKKIDNFSQTVLHLACLGGNLNIVQQLIEQDCVDTEIKDRNGKKAVDLARARLNNDIVDYIERYNRDRRTHLCNLKTLLFGPVGNSKFIFLIIHLLYWLYQYPVYFYQVMPDTWNDHFGLNIAYLVNHVIMWISYYSVHLKNPGYIKQNTNEYKNLLKRITFSSQNFKETEWSKNLNRLCHTCKAVKPLRASHCRACNRCVLAFDHHCPYVQNCVGYNNRPWFFVFVFATTTLQIITARLLYIILSKSWTQYIFYPAVVIVVFFGIMAFMLTFSAISSAFFNLTTNELMKKKKYDYLQTLIGGKKKSLFDKGVIYNCRYYFHLVEPSYLEIEDFDSRQDYTV